MPYQKLTGIVVYLSLDHLSDEEFTKADAIHIMALRARALGLRPEALFSDRLRTCSNTICDILGLRRPAHLNDKRVMIIKHLPD